MTVPGKGGAGRKIAAVKRRLDALRGRPRYILGLRDGDAALKRPSPWHPNRLEHPMIVAITDVRVGEKINVNGRVRVVESGARVAGGIRLTFTRQMSGGSAAATWPANASVDVVSRYPAATVYNGITGEARVESASPVVGALAVQP